MNVLESLDGLSRVWGDWMLQMAWQVVPLVLILTALTWLWRRKSAGLLHTLWLLVLVRLVLPPAFAFPTGWAFWVLPAASDLRARQSDSAPPALAGSYPTVSKTMADSRHDDSVVQNAAAERAPTTALTADLPPSSPVTSSTSKVPAGPEPITRPVAARSWSSSLMLAWAGVAGTLLGFLFWGSIRVRGWVREAEPIDDPDLYSLLEDCRQRLGVTRLVELRNSESCTTPVVVGVRRPVILLPKAVLSRLSTAEMKAVLLHELNHIARGDAIVNLLQGVLGAVYFFHPLVWWANASLRRFAGRSVRRADGRGTRRGTTRVRRSAGQSH